MNLLNDNWIPVELGGVPERISLQKLLCEDLDCVIKSFRDDMELAALQLLVCLVQVAFIPDDKEALKRRWERPMSESEYRQGIEAYLEWFDLLHPKTPFMQTASVAPGANKITWASIQKLFIGLPEKSSSSRSSSAFFDTTDELDSIHIGDAAIALFQQATNGLGLGSHYFSVGLKGSVPLTTLILSKRLRKTIWCNVLSQDFLKPFQILEAPLQEPTWVMPPHSKFGNEQAHHIGLVRGLFWQPAKVKLEIINGKVTGFYKETGPCSVQGFWLHPHTPTDLLRLKAGSPKEKPYLSAQADLPLWGQMLSYFYSPDQADQLQGMSASPALVVQQFRRVWPSEEIHLAVGGYVKGNSTESLAGRRHEIYSLAQEWQDKSGELHHLVDFALKCQQRLNLAVGEFSDTAEKSFKDRRDKIPKKPGKDGLFKKNLKVKAKQLYFSNSESLMHGILKEFQWSDDLEPYQNKFKKLAATVFEQVVSPYEHEDKMLEPVLTSRQFLHNMLAKLSNPQTGAKA